MRRPETTNARRQPTPRDNRDAESSVEAVATDEPCPAILVQNYRDGPIE